MGKFQRPASLTGRFGRNSWKNLWNPGDFDRWRENFLLDSMTLQKFGQIGCSEKDLGQRMRDLEGRAAAELSHRLQVSPNAIRRA